MDARSRRRWALLALTLAGMALTARLGAWQLDRAAQKEWLAQQLLDRGAQPVLTAAQLSQDARTAAEQHYRRVELTGRWLPNSTRFLDNRQMGNQVGFFVVSALELAADGRIVVVQRGFAPRDSQDRSRVPPVTTPGGEIRVRGRVAPPPSKLLELGAEGQGLIRQNLDFAAYSIELRRALAPVSVIEDDPPAVPDGLSRHWPAPTVDVSRHYGYAFQWFAMAVTMAVLFVWFQLIRPFHRERTSA